MRSARLALGAARFGMMRAAAMLLTLAAVTLTYRALSPAAFTGFNMILFLIAVGSAIATPVNRAFWEGNHVRRYAPATLSSMAIVALAVGIGGVALGPLIGVAAMFYGAVRVIERFGYGRLLAAGSDGRAIAPILLFAIVEVAASALLYALSLDSLLARLLLAALAFVVMVAAAPFRSLLVEIAPTRARLAEALAFARRHILSVQGARVIGIGVLAAAASAGDRLLAAVLPLDQPAFAAAFLLAVSYGIALQTLTAFLFDMARVRVFSDGRWGRDARPFMTMVAAASIGLVLSAAAAYPLLVASGLLPGSIGVILWAGLVARSMAAALAFTLNVDHYQQGRFAPIAIANMIILGGGTSAYLLLRAGAGQDRAGMVLILVAVALTAAMAWRFASRLGVAARQGAR